jgi:aerobic carbon-monoxide dehydrogenase large subunit
MTTPTEPRERSARATLRREDDRLLTGRGQYVDDLAHPGALVVAFVRSPYPSARILSVDAAEALALPGVQGIVTAADLQADGVDPMPAPIRLPRAGGGAWTATPRPLLAAGCVRFVGEAVAMVLAESATAALDAAERVLVEYDATPAVADVVAAGDPQAPQVWADRPGNLAFEWQQGDVQRLEAALAASHHVARLQSRISRVYAAPLEPRAALAWPDEQGRTVLRLSHQAPHQMRNELLRAFGVQRTDVRVVAGDVGGSFGMKSGPLREEMLVFWAARRLRRAVRWTASRSEAFLADDQGRDLRVSGELGLDAQGRFTALRVRYDINVGAFFSWRSSVPVINFGGIAGVYSTPVIVGEARGFFSHTPVTAPYRGAGRPEATYALERLIDAAAAEMGLDPAELRRRNLIAASAMPYQTGFTFRYDCGDFERNLDRALALAAYAGFEQRRAEALQRGRLRGIGMALPIEVAAGPYSNPAPDWATVQADPDGTVTLATGAMSVGQGLDTALSSVVAGQLGVPLERVRYAQGDTDAIADGKGSGGSGGLIVSGTAAMRGVTDLVDKAKAIAARELEVAAEDLVFGQGVFRVAGSDLTLSLAEVARAALRPEHGGQPLAGAATFEPQATFPNGCHVCEVEIDPAIGQVRVVGYVSVEDVGHVLHPVLVEGQIHGGVAQGVGQALLEEIRYDEQGQLVTGSFMDYAMPRAEDLPPIVGENPETPTALNPLGVKGVGEAGTVGALAATMNAVCDALRPAGVRHIDMPATPVRVWEALREAGWPPARRRGTGNPGSRVG